LEAINTIYSKRTWFICRNLDDANRKALFIEARDWKLERHGKIGNPE
jgi:hypothetical protein